MANELKDMRIAIVATDMVEESELTEVREALEAAGAITELIAPKEGEIIAANHFDKSRKYDVDATLEEIDAEEYDAVYLPGGALNADQIRKEPLLQRFLQHMNDSDKPIAAICHAAWELISAGIVEGHTLTSYDSIADDVRNAGGEWVDEPVVIDGNLISSRKPDDIPKFNIAMIKLFSNWKTNTFAAM